MPIAKPKKASVKTEAARMVRDLPESATWEDLMYQVYVRQKIESGLADVKAGRTHDHASVLKEFGLNR